MGWVDKGRKFKTCKIWTTGWQAEIKGIDLQLLKKIN